MDPTSVPTLTKQIDICPSLIESILIGLTDDEALWCPSPDSWTVREDAGGRWHADWTEPEPWPAPPTSIAWIQWHVIWWWSMVLDHSFGNGELQRTDVTWPGAAEALTTINGLRIRWLDRLGNLTDDDLSGNRLTRWPYTDGRPFALVAGWVGFELTKNVSEMCLLRRMTPLFPNSMERPTEPEPSS